MNELRDELELDFGEGILLVAAVGDGDVGCDWDCLASCCARLFSGVAGSEKR